MAKEQDVFVTSSGLKIKLKKVSPMLLQKVMNSIEMPKRPTYEAKTISGRVEVWPMDKESAEQMDHGQSRWDYYQEELSRAQNTLNDRVMNVAFLYGTEVEIPENGWAEMQEMIGIDVPPVEQKERRKAHYLVTELNAEDVSGLMLALWRVIGTPEDVISEAQNSFSSAVRDGQEAA